jgi:hypothetical protein
VETLLQAEEKKDVVAMRRIASAYAKNEMEYSIAEQPRGTEPQVGTVQEQRQNTIAEPAPAQQQVPWKRQTRR